MKISLNNKPFTVKTLSISALFLFMSLVSLGQTFYVEPSEKGYESKISEKLKYEGYKLASTEAESDYVVKCLLSGRYNAMSVKRMFQGYVTISDTKTGKELARSKEVKRNPAALNGFNAGGNIFGVIADKYLIDMVKKLN